MDKLELCDKIHIPTGVYEYIRIVPSGSFLMRFCACKIFQLLNFVLYLCSFVKTSNRAVFAYCFPQMHACACLSTIFKISNWIYGSFQINSFKCRKIERKSKRNRFCINTFTNPIENNYRVPSDRRSPKNAFVVGVLRVLQKNSPTADIQYQLVETIERWISVLPFWHHFAVLEVAVPLIAPYDGDRSR